MTRPDQPIDDQAVAWQTFEEMLPWGVSVLVHVALVLLAVFFAWSVQQQAPDEERVTATIRWHERPDKVTTELSERVSESRTAAGRPMPRGVGDPAATRVFQTTSVSATGIGWLAPGQDTAANPWDKLLESNQHHDSAKIFVADHGRSVVFLIDASGSLIDTLPFVLDELRRSIAQLHHTQRFAVIFFQGGGIIEAPPLGLTQANEAGKAATLNWLAQRPIVARGYSNPVAALQQALKYQPELIFLLSDDATGSGPYEIDQRRLLAEIARANTAKTRISTIQFLYPDPLERVGLTGTMKRISTMTGGRYKFVSARELNIE